MRDFTISMSSFAAGLFVAGGIAFGAWWARRDKTTQLRAQATAEMKAARDLGAAYVNALHSGRLYLDPVDEAEVLAAVEADDTMELEPIRPDGYHGRRRRARQSLRDRLAAAVDELLANLKDANAPFDWSAEPQPTATAAVAQDAEAAGDNGVSDLFARIEPVDVDERELVPA